MKKFIFWAMILLFILPVFSLAGINSVIAQTNCGDNCVAAHGCSGSGLSCVNGVCVCPSGQTCKDGECEDSSGGGTTDSDDLLWGGKKGDITDIVGLNADRDPRQIAATVIRVILGFLGIIAVILILYGGFLWMTASGNEENVDKAKKLLMAGVIGLVIILASFALATFVLTQLGIATGNP